MLKLEEFIKKTLESLPEEAYNIEVEVSVFYSGENVYVSNCEEATKLKIRIK